MKSESAARLRVLLLEDNPADAELVLYELRHAGIEADSVRVITREDFEARLDPCPDVILSDYHLPLWDGLQALRLVRERGLDIPFIIVSGTIGEDLAVDAMRHGADDYLLKDRLSRLGASVTQALDRKRLEQERARAEREIERVKARYQLIFDHAAAGIILSTIKGGILAINPAGAAMLGYGSPEEVVAAVTEISTQLYADPQERDAVHERMDREGEVRDFALRYYRKDGSTVPVSQTTRVLVEEYEGRKLAISIVQDMTERKQAEQRLLESEARYHGLIEQASDGIFVTDIAGNYILVNSRGCELLGYTETELLGLNARDTYIEEEREIHARRIEQVRTGETLRFERMVRRKDGSTFSAEISSKMLDNGLIQVIFHDITERKEAEALVRESEARFRSFVEQSPDAMIIHQAGRIVFVNDAMVRLMRAGEAGTLLGKPRISLVHAGHADIAEQRRARLYSGQTVPLIDQVYVRSDGTSVEVEVAASPIVLDGKPAALVTVREITERKEQERKIARLSRIHRVLSGINSAIVRIRNRKELFQEACRIAVEYGGFSSGWISMLDPAGGKLLQVAQAGLPIDFYADGDSSDRTHGMVPAGVSEVALREKRPAFDNDIQQAPDVTIVRQAAIRASANSVIALPLIVESVPVGILALYAQERDFFDDEELKLLTELAGDISFGLEFIAKEEKVDYLAYYDALTGLANRSLFLERVTQYMRSAASGGHKLALFLIDLERFKNINDSLGRPAGDALLRQVAEWLTRNAGDANLLARVGADNFAVVLPEVKQEGDVAWLLEKTMKVFLEHPFRLNDAVFRIAAKLGVALYPDDGDSADTLFRNAEAALKKAKMSGDRYLFYTQKMTETVAGRLTLENQLRQALDNEEFVLHYQPKVDLLSGKLTSAEALIRWNDPRTGLVAPGRFIPILEETGLIYEVGRWALRRAIEDYLRWRAAGLPAVRIAVNVSPLQLRHRGFIAEIKQVIGIDAQAAAGLELEITESLIMEDVKRSIASLQAIRAMGVSIAIDDFGTGFSSLSYLAKLPVDTLKIDHSFVIDMTAGPEGLALVSTIINLAHSLKLKVVAEGVETEEQSRLLRLLNCDEMQGYLFSKPVPGEIFETRFLALPSGYGSRSDGNNAE